MDKLFLGNGRCEREKNKIVGGNDEAGGYDVEEEGKRRRRRRGEGEAGASKQLASPSWALCYSPA